MATPSLLLYEGFYMIRDHPASSPPPPSRGETLFTASYHVVVAILASFRKLPRNPHPSLSLSPHLKPNRNLLPSPLRRRFSPSPSPKPPTKKVALMPASSLKPLTLVPELHPEYHHPTTASSATSAKTPPETPPESPSRTLPTPPTTPPPNTITPFSKPIPDTIDPNYLTICAPGLHYALYTLVPLTSHITQTLLDTLAFHALCEDNPPAIVLAPTHDFSHPSRRTIRDIYDYHTSLLSVIRSNPWNLHTTRFLVLCHRDWESNGLLLVELDTHPEVRGIVGMSRVAVDMAGSSLVLKAEGSYTFADFKVEEYARGFKEGIEGYEGSKWEKLGMEWYEEGEYRADDEASEDGSVE